jgi:diguanylate cyclase (GGDEF)-like protein
MAGRLQATVREEDTVARLGGDEFIIALGQISGPDYAATVARKVIEAVSRQPYVIEGNGVSITTSAGVSIYPVHGEDVDTLMKSADLALYAAKHAGKNTYKIAGCNDLAAAARRQHGPPTFRTPLPSAADKRQEDQ